MLHHLFIIKKEHVTIIILPRRDCAKKGVTCEGAGEVHCSDWRSYSQENLAWTLYKAEFYGEVVRGKPLFGGMGGGGVGGLTTSM